MCGSANLVSSVKVNLFKKQVQCVTLHLQVKSEFLMLKICYGAEIFNFFLCELVRCSIYMPIGMLGLLEKIK